MSLTDPYQDRSELKDAFEISSRRLLHAKGVGRLGHALYGPRAYPSVRLEVVQTNGCGHHSFPVWNEPRGGSADSKLVPIRSTVGSRYTHFSQFSLFV